MKARFSEGNKSGLVNTVKGFYGGQEYTFTHRNPATGEWWTDEIKNQDDTYGRWVSPEKIELRKEVEG